jgi:hypothetical protein
MFNPGPISIRSLDETEYRVGEVVKRDADAVAWLFMTSGRSRTSSAHARLTGEDKRSCSAAGEIEHFDDAVGIHAEILHGTPCAFAMMAALNYFFDFVMLENIADELGDREVAQKNSVPAIASLGSSVRSASVSNTTGRTPCSTSLRRTGGAIDAQSSDYQHGHFAPPHTLERLRHPHPVALLRRPIKFSDLATLDIERSLTLNVQHAVICPSCGQEGAMGADSGPNERCRPAPRVGKSEDIVLTPGSAPWLLRRPFCFASPTIAGAFAVWRGAPARRETLRIATHE